MNIGALSQSHVLRKKKVGVNLKEIWCELYCIFKPDLTGKFFRHLNKFQFSGDLAVGKFQDHVEWLINEMKHIYSQNPKTSKILKRVNKTYPHYTFM